MCGCFCLPEIHRRAVQGGGEVFSVLSFDMLSQAASVCLTAVEGALFK